MVKQVLIKRFNEIQKLLFYFILFYFISSKHLKKAAGLDEYTPKNKEDQGIRRYTALTL